ncbi:hypothetical protein K2173_014079 [Erythroxylum novogranatense]|uniref:Phytocyanin domain-containing protein n=1 Tax=Erythroxylum novogranatense TaxID=1862640 RepID=A0AAV8SDN3_9ROSI|nr:hypothetical protein K2173_014079 [Erythroxylum novogranatense]
MQHFLWLSSKKMEEENYRRSVSLVFHAFYFLLLLSVSGSVSAYKNYTVGDALGWYDSTEKSGVNYQKWADGKKFSLGDFLIFNTNTNHSVIQTYNSTTYELCDYDDAQDDDIYQWSAADPSNTATQPITVPVPLVKEGTTYFFSGDYDGDQCRSGQHFQINVTHGQGLPESLKSPENQAPAPNSPDVNGEDSVPDTVVPANFDHPDRQKEADAENDSGSLSLHVKSLKLTVYEILFLLGLVNFLT